MSEDTVETCSFGKRCYKTTWIYEFVHDKHSTNKSCLWSCFFDPGMPSSSPASPVCHSETPSPGRHCSSFHLPSPLELELISLPWRLPASTLHHCYSYTCIIPASCNILEGRTMPCSIHRCVPLKCLRITTACSYFGMQCAYIIASDSQRLQWVRCWRLYIDLPIWSHNSRMKLGHKVS